MLSDNSITPTLEIIKICLAEKRVVYRWSAAVTIVLGLLFLLLVAYFFKASVSINPKDLPANFEFLIGTFFENILLPQVIILIAWYVSVQKTNANRLNEYKFLTSLPFTGRQIFSRFMISEFLGYSWIPLAFSLLYFGLASITSFLLITRLILFSFLFHLCIQSLQIFLQLLVLSKTETTRFNYVVQGNPIIVIITLVLYEAGHLLALFKIYESSPREFMFLAGGILFLSVFLLMGAASLFSHLHKNDFWHKIHQAITKERHLNRFLDRLYLGIKNPFLFKNLVSLSRSRSNLIGSLLTLTFFAIAYLLAMNNQASDDILAVLFVFTVTYILLYNLVAINNLSQQREPAKLLQSLPTKKSALYMAFLIPTAGWLTLVISMLTFWLYLKGVNSGTLLVFWLKLLISTVVANVISLNCALGYYPNINMGKNRYFMWLLFIIMFSVIFYEFTIWIAVAIAAVTFIELRKLKFFQT